MAPICAALAHSRRHSWVTCDTTRVFGRWRMRTDFRKPTARLPALARLGAFVYAHQVRRPCCMDNRRVERGCLVSLQDHCAALAAHASHFRIRSELVEQVLALEHHPPADERCRRHAAAADCERQSVLLPEPDSPTMPRVPPASMLSVTSSTALTTPALRVHSGQRDFSRARVHRLRNDMRPSQLAQLRGRVSSSTHITRSQSPSHDLRQHHHMMP